MGLGLMGVVLMGSGFRVLVCVYIGSVMLILNSPHPEIKHGALLYKVSYAEYRQTGVSGC